VSYSLFNSISPKYDCGRQTAVTSGIIIA